jgi:hypothetical protein
MPEQIGHRSFFNVAIPPLNARFGTFFEKQQLVATCLPAIFQKKL